MDNYLKLYKKGKEMPATFLNSIRQKGICSWKNEPRYLMYAPIVCSYLNFVQSGKVVGGIMKNCCANGLHAELAAHFKTGTVLVFRTTGSSGGGIPGRKASIRWP